MSLLHVIIHAGFSAADMDRAFLGRILLAFPVHFISAIPAAWLCGARLLSLRLPGAFLFLILIVFDVAGFHVEAATGKYLQLTEYSYIGELGHIWPSIRESGMLLWVLLEILLCLLIILQVLRAVRVRFDKGAFTGTWFAWSAVALFSACILAGGTVLGAPLRFGIRAGDITPLSSVLMDLGKGTEPPAGKTTISRSEIESLRRFLGNPVPLEKFSPDNPLCTGGTGKATPAIGNGKSVILLILESIGRKQFDSEVDGLPLMPHLKRIARENLYFKNFFPSGEGSIQAMFPIFTGIIPETAARYIRLDFLPNFEGFPRVLQEQGYRTGYFHGGDLGFEKQRVVLRRVGFEEIIEYDPSSPKEKYGWGYSDGDMLGQLRNWISLHRKNNRDVPYFTTLFTLGTHHPYTLPPGWEKGASNPLIQKQIIDSHTGLSSERKKFLKSVIYLDEELRVFYDWYVKREMPRGTQLFIVSDHPMQAEGFFSRYDFKIPLIIAAPGHNKEAIQGAYLSRLAGHSDIPATMAHLLEVPSPPCNQGVNILARPEEWSSDRLIYSVSKGLDKVYVWAKKRSWVFDRKSRKVFVLPDSKSNRTLALSPDAGRGREIRFLKLVLKVNYRLAGLLHSNPPAERDRAVASHAGDRGQTIMVSHRGNTRGAPDDRAGNDIASIEKAIHAGFRWVEVDVNITRDLVPVVFHDSVVRDHKGNEELISNLTLDAVRQIPGMEHLATLEEILDKFGQRVGLLVELKSQGTYFLNSHLVHGTARILKRLNMEHRVIVDSFSPYIASSMKSYSDCEVAWDAPLNIRVSDGWLLGVKQMGLDWVYISRRQARAEVIKAARNLGIKVMVYTVNTPDEFLRIRKLGPDGIMTDYTSILENAKRAHSS
jgi:glycerophosphoryl diester phosphodiesterase